MRTLVSLTGTIGLLGGLRENTVVMARRRRRRRPGGQAVGRGGRCAPISTGIVSHTHTARSLACPLLTLASATPFSNGIFRSHDARVPPPRVLLPHTCTQDGWFLQPQRRPARLPRRAVPSDCICRCGHQGKTADIFIPKKV